MSKFTNFKRNVETAGMSEIQTAVFKATTADKLPPKEKHSVDNSPVALVAKRSTAGASML